MIQNSCRFCPITQALRLSHGAATSPTLPFGILQIVQAYSCSSISYTSNFKCDKRKDLSWIMSLVHTVGRFPVAYSCFRNSFHKTGSDKYFCKVNDESCAIAQVVSPRLSTAASQVPVLVGPCWIDGGQSGTGVRFLRVLTFRYHFSFHPLLYTTHHHHHRPSSWAGTLGQRVAGVPSRLKPKKLRNATDESVDQRQVQIMRKKREGSHCPESWSWSWS
jgi:hypothetical protein